MKRALVITALLFTVFGLCCLNPGHTALAQSARPPLVVPPDVVERGRRQAAPRPEQADEQLPVPMGDELNRKRIQAALFFKRGETEKGLELLSQLMNRHPKNLDLRMDYADALLEAKELKRLDHELGFLKKQIPANPRLRFLEARTLMQKDEYAQADTILLGLLKESPRRADYLAEHGRAQLHMGNYNEAIAVFKRSLLTKPNQPWLRRDLARLIRERSTKLTTRTLYVDQAHQTSFFRNEIAFMGPVAESLKLGLKWRGNFVHRDEEQGSPAASEQNQAVLIMGEYDFSPRFKLGGAAGPVLEGPEVFSYAMNASYVWPDKARVKGLFEINNPWDDPVLAAESGGLVDRAALEGEVSAVKKWVLGYGLEFRRYYLEKDEHYADRWIGSLNLGRVLFARPYVLLSGTWYYSRVDKEEDFSQELFTPEENSLGLSLYTENQFSSYLTGWGSFSGRRDIRREMTAFDAALGLRWKILPFLSLKPGYYYTNDSESIGGGDSHNILLETEFTM